MKRTFATDGAAALRLFFAIRVPPVPALQAVVAELRQQRTPAQWVDPKLWHLTLAFLPEVSPSAVAGLRACGTIVAMAAEPFRAELAGLGTFPPRGQPRVLWAGLGQPLPLMALGVHLHRELAHLGFPQDRPFTTPHLTLARFKSPPPFDFRDWLQTQPATVFAPLNVTAIELIQSELAAGGPTYITLATFPLGVVGPQASQPRSS